jgi:hypothetical protein
VLPWLYSFILWFVMLNCSQIKFHHIPPYSRAMARLHLPKGAHADDGLLIVAAASTWFERCGAPSICQQLSGPESFLPTASRFLGRFGAWSASDDKACTGHDLCCGCSCSNLSPPKSTSTPGKILCPETVRGWGTSSTRMADLSCRSKSTCPLSIDSTRMASTGTATYNSAYVKSSANCPCLPPRYL